MAKPSWQDRVDIEELLYRYAWMVDQRRWELMDSVFTPDAMIDYTSTGGQAGPVREALAWLDRALAGWQFNLHAISNVCIDFRQSPVRARCQFFAPMGRPDGDGQQEHIVNAGYYYDELVRTGDGWRIAHRRCEQTVRIGQLPAGYHIPE